MLVDLLAKKTQYFDIENNDFFLTKNAFSFFPLVVTIYECLYELQVFFYWS